MTIIDIEEHSDSWVELDALSPRLKRAVRRLVTSDLSADAEYVVALSIEKFLDGTDEHGALDLMDVDELREGLKELIDLSHYGSMGLVKLMRRAGLITD